MPVKGISIRSLSDAAASMAPSTPAEAGEAAKAPGRHTTSNMPKHTGLNVHEAIKLVKESAWAKFDETIELSVNLNLDPRKPNQAVKGVAKLPSGTGKTVRVGVFAVGKDADAASEAGADL